MGPTFVELYIAAIDGFFKLKGNTDNERGEHAVRLSDEHGFPGTITNFDGLAVAETVATPGAVNGYVCRTLRSAA